LIKLVDIVFKCRIFYVYPARYMMNILIHFMLLSSKN
jgi:hypothetical protein